MNNYKSLLLALGLLPASLETHAQLVINEFMQSNVDCIMDDLNEFPDSWVEIYNPGSKDVYLSGYKLGITEDFSSAWQLPFVVVSPKQHVIVYCDKEASGLHTDFRLESGNDGEIYLFTKNGAIVDSLKGLSKQPAPNVAYGRKTDGATEWGYQKTATPAASNCGTFVSEVLELPLFSHPGRVVENGEAFDLELSLPEGAPEATVIRYTTDGSEPTAESPLYTSPINIDKTTIVRATTFCDGYITPRSATQSYVNFGREITLPVVSIAADSSFFYDDKIGIYVDGTYSETKKNFTFDWRRPMNFEIFWNPGEESVINQLGEARVQGGTTRVNARKSLAIYANKRFGEKRFKYEFFPERRPGVKKFKSLVLRNAGNDFDYLYMRDAIIQSHVSKFTDVDWSAWQPTIVYINGKYMGILSIRDRANEDYIYTYYDGLEDVDVIENWNSVKEGDNVNLNAFKAFYAEEGHTRAEYEKWMDTSDFMNLMITATFFTNVDFPGGNILMWRPRTEDGRWRWILKDFDFTLGLYGRCEPSFKYFDWLYDPNYHTILNWANSEAGTLLFRHLMEDDSFKNEFIERSAIYMGDFLNFKSIWKTWEPMYNMIKTEYPYHRTPINKWWPQYDTELENAKAWVAERPEYVYQNLSDFYGAGTPVPMTINTSLEAGQLDSVKVAFNGIKLSEGVFDGSYFANRNVTLTTEATGGKEVKGWTVCATNGSSTSSFEVKGSEYSFFMPQCTSLSITANIGTLDGIEAVGADNISWKRNGNVVVLTGVAAGENVSVCDLSGMQLSSVTSDGGNVVVELTRPLVVIKAGDKVVKVTK